MPYIPLLPNDLEVMDSNITNLVFPDYSYNDLTYTVFNISCFTFLTNLEVKYQSFIYVNIFIIDGAQYLQNVTIGDYSFDFKPHSENQNLSFSIMNCPNLKNILISGNSFTDYSGSFVVENLPSLETLAITGSFCFYHIRDFVLKGIYVFKTLYIQIVESEIH